MEIPDVERIFSSHLYLLYIVSQEKKAKIRIDFYTWIILFNLLYTEIFLQWAMYSEHILYVIHHRIPYPSKEFVQAIKFNLFPSLGYVQNSNLSSPLIKIVFLYAYPYICTLYIYRILLIPFLLFILLTRNIINVSKRN